MSGDGSDERISKKGLNDKDEDDPPSQRIRHDRPQTARPRTRGRDSLSSQGAVCGEGHSHSRKLTEQERVAGSQAHFLLEDFISDRARRENIPSQQRAIVEAAVSNRSEGSQSGSRRIPSVDSLKDVSLALRDIGDQISQDGELNRLIEMVVIQSPRDIFMKVCKQIFADGQFNWGRVAAVFYFAYRLITKAVSITMDQGIPLIKEIFSWCMDFFYDYVVSWVVLRGGWIMIKEYFGPSAGTLVTIGAAAILTVLYVWWKQQ